MAGIDKLRTDNADTVRIDAFVGQYSPKLVAQPSAADQVANMIRAALEQPGCLGVTLTAHQAAIVLHGLDGKA